MFIPSLQIFKMSESSTVTGSNANGECANAVDVNDDQLTFSSVPASDGDEEASTSADTMATGVPESIKAGPMKMTFSKTSDVRKKLQASIAVEPAEHGDDDGSETDEISHLEGRAIKS
jgi:hypothetical protein